jgi:hypothetical protein
MYEKFLSFLICALHLSKSPGTYIDKLRNPENAPEIKFCFKIYLDTKFSDSKISLKFLYSEILRKKSFSL